MVLLDLDHFKSINDTAGHAGGDAVLRAVAGHLQATLRPGETACRYGGEEFVVVLPGLGTVTTTARPERWCREIGALRVGFGGQVLPVSVPLGVASSPVHGRNPEAVLLAADQALYRAKAQGRGCWQAAAPDLSLS